VNDKLNLKAVEQFKIAFSDLGINITPKIHAVIHHIPEFCEMKQRGLGPWSEQSSEAAHHDFTQTWNRYKVKSYEHPEFPSRILRAISTYNGSHL